MYQLKSFCSAVQTHSLYVAVFSLSYSARFNREIFHMVARERKTMNRLAYVVLLLVSIMLSSAVVLNLQKPLAQEAPLLSVLQSAYGSRLSDFRWNSNADLNKDGTVSLADLVLCCGTTVNDGQAEIDEKGTVTYLGFEGGFYGIVGDDGKHYDPIDMPQEFKVDGLRVHFTANFSDFLSYHMWGYVVRLISIEKLP